MKCPNCKTPIKFLELIRITHKSPYSCPVCFRKSVFNHSKKFLNLIGGLAGLAGVIFFYSFEKYGWIYGLIAISVLIIVVLIIFIKYAELEIIDSK
ncbi:MAG: hypothetical protein ACR2NW_00485 [Thermodesulfobacteriota bacterium]